MPQYVAAGAKRVFVGQRNPDGVLIGGLTGAAAGGVSALLRLRGLITMPVPTNTPSVVVAVGDDNETLNQFTFNSPDVLQGEMQLTSIDPDFVALAESTVVRSHGAEITQIVWNPNNPIYVPLVYVAHSQAQLTPDGTKRYQTIIALNVNTKPLNQTINSAQVNAYPYSNTFNPTSLTPWGESLATVDDGTTSATAMSMFAPNPMMLTAFLGDGTETQFTLPYLPAAASADAVRIWVDGVAQTYTTDFTVDAGTGVVTFEAGSIPAAAEYGVVLYQVLESEL